MGGGGGHRGVRKGGEGVEALTVVTIKKEKKGALEKKLLG